MKYAIVLVVLLLGGCNPYDACTPESAQRAGDYFARCLAGDGYSRPAHSTCGDYALDQKFCVPVTKKLP